jgi:hypothetical protein
MLDSVKKALADWSRLMKMDDVRILDTTCLGDVIFKNSEGNAFVLDVGAGEIRTYDAGERELVSEQNRLVSKFEQQGLKLGSGQCYGLKPNAIFKPYEAENIYVATLVEYVSFMGNFHHQIKDLPDGSPIRLRVIQ